MISLPNINLAATVVGTKARYTGMTNAITGYSPGLIQKYGKAQLVFFNESPDGLRITFDQSTKSFDIPAGYWGIHEVEPDDSTFTWEVLYQLSNAQVNLVLLTLYAPGENVPSINVLGNSPINGIVTVADITAQFLEGDAQVLPFTEIDTGSGNPMLIPANGAGIATAIGARDAGNVVREIVDIGATVGNEFTVIRGDGSGNLGAVHADDYYMSGQVVTLDGLFTQGNTGVPAILIKQVTTGIVSTAAQTLVDYTPTATGMYRANMFIRVNNGTSPQNISAQISYHNAFSGATDVKRFTFNDDTANLIATGAVAFANRGFPGIPLVFYADTGAHIQFIYRDPANTPNDSVACYLEYLG